jgi:hypothetical protein
MPFKILLPGALNCSFVCLNTTLARTSKGLFEKVVTFGLVAGATNKVKEDLHVHSRKEPQF